MSKDALIVVLGFWVALLPFLGFPGSWRTFFLVLSGLAIAGIGLWLRRELIAHGVLSLMRRGNRESYVEHDGFTGTEASETARS